MPQTPREIVRRCLTFQTPERMPRQMWVLPWAAARFPGAVAQVRARFPDDITGAPIVYRPSPREKGDRYALGTSVDAWGCVFENIQEGAIGEVRDPILKEIGDWKTLEPPYEALPADRDAARDEVNRFCAATDLHVHAACCPRPWERMQFLRGSANAMMDIMEPEKGARALLKKIHAFHLAELEFWVSTGVDGIMFMDDWGAQEGLLVNPEVWRDLFKPLYRDYCDLAHANGKFIFMHSDGHIQAILEDLVDVGVDAINAQLFVMDMAAVARAVKGRITFWGEIDRQHVLPSKDPEAVREAVRRVAEHLYDPRGGVIAQFEFGLAARPENAMLVFEEWEKVEREMKGKHPPP